MDPDFANWELKAQLKELVRSYGVTTPHGAAINRALYRIIELEADFSKAAYLLGHASVDATRWRTFMDHPEVYGAYRSDTANDDWELVSPLDLREYLDNLIVEENPL